jgi:uncharacterized protein
MRCKYCYVPEHMRGGNTSMSASDMERVIDKFLAYVSTNGGCRRVIFHGGEPCLVKDRIFGIIDKSYQGEHDIEFSIQTNGTLFNADDVAFVKERHVHISLSLDGVSPEVNYLTRLYKDGRSTFSDVRQTIEWFSDYDWQGVIVTVTRHNVSHLEEIARAFHGWGVRASLFNPVSPINHHARHLMAPLDVLVSNYKRLIDALIEVNTHSPERRLVVDNIESIVMSLLTSNVRVLYCNMSSCGAGRFIWVVSADGTVYPDSEFMGLSGFALGNALTDDVKQIVNSPVLQDLRGRHVSTIEECRDCAFREICGANCPAAVHGMHGTLRAKGPYCTFTQEIVKYIFEKIADNGLDVVYKLVSSDFERRLRGADKLVDLTA